MPWGTNLPLNLKCFNRKIKTSKSCSNPSEWQDSSCPNKCRFSDNKLTMAAVGCRKGESVCRAGAYLQNIWTLGFVPLPWKSVTTPHEFRSQQDYCLLTQKPVIPLSHITVPGINQDVWKHLDLETADFGNTGCFRAELSQDKNGNFPSWHLVTKIIYRYGTLAAFCLFQLILLYTKRLWW